MTQKMYPRIRVLIIFNLLMFMYYFRFFWRSLAWDWDFQTPLYFLSSFGLLISSFFLMNRQKKGKIVLKWVGLLGVIAILGVAIWGLLLLDGIAYVSKFHYENIIVNVLVYTIRHAYPIIAGFVILNKPDEELGLY